jgi:hypothetical protein
MSHPEFKNSVRSYTFVVFYKRVTPNGVFKIRDLLELKFSNGPLKNILFLCLNQDLKVARAKNDIQ